MLELNTVEVITTYSNSAGDNREQRGGGYYPYYPRALENERLTGYRD